MDAVEWAIREDLRPYAHRTVEAALVGGCSADAADVAGGCVGGEHVSFCRVQLFCNDTALVLIQSILTRLLYLLLVSCLFVSLFNSALTSVNLFNNSIGVEGVKALAAVLPSR